MPTYVVGDIHITDSAAFQAHVPRALATIARWGGRVIAGGGRIDLLEGDPMPERIFIIEFATSDAARQWYPPRIIGSLWKPGCPPRTAVYF
jgi:uncharacterized protein (DUF1330 family)